MFRGHRPHGAWAVSLSSQEPRGAHTGHRAGLGKGQPPGCGLRGPGTPALTSPGPSAAAMGPPPPGRRDGTPTGRWVRAPCGCSPVSWGADRHRVWWAPGFRGQFLLPPLFQHGPGLGASVHCRGGTRPRQRCADTADLPRGFAHGQQRAGARWQPLCGQHQHLRLPAPRAAESGTSCKEVAAFHPITHGRAGSSSAEDVLRPAVHLSVRRLGVHLLQEAPWSPSPAGPWGAPPPSFRVLPSWQSCPAISTCCRLHAL